MESLAVWVYLLWRLQNYYASQTDLVKYGLDKDSRITVDITYKDMDTKKTKMLCFISVKKILIKRIIMYS